ncbi:MAG TPA: glycosyl hydrolase family 28 protein [Candidatus Limnocylindrales bacterium]|nr:glycosyl hydrolase family 28 protein [Candidatus Limnocylindrales bacterium]
MSNAPTRRAVLAGAALFLPLRAKAAKTYDVAKYGATGDGKTLDTAAIQKAIDAAAAAGGGQVLIRGGRKYLITTLKLRSNIDLHLADDAQLLASTNRADYPQGADGLLTCDSIRNLKITGTGNIDGRAMEFMTGFNKEGEIWRFGPFRPKIFVLTACHGLEIKDITFSHAAFWGLHMLGCEHVLVDGVKIRNDIDVPNCDGIDPDHCRDVEIRNCDIVCGDDAIVIKTTRQPKEYGPSANITVKDCTMQTKDSALKIGTETTSDVHGIRFENCTAKSCCRGITIQLRDEGNVYDIDFNNIKFSSQYQAAPWWGRGEPISFTAIPRAAGGKVGRIHDIRVRNVTARAENSVRIDGTPESRIAHVTLDHLDLTMERWTNYPGPVFDNRPTTAYPGTPEHKTPAIHIAYADGVTIENCKVTWGSTVPEYFTHAVEAENATGVEVKRLQGGAARPGMEAIVK